jgi:hypothetical protein
MVMCPQTAKDKFMDNEGISENFSEKRKRGRPRLLHPALHEVFAQGQQYASERTIQNASYHIRAFSLLQDEPWAKWLMGYVSQEGKPGQIRKTILAELGRLREDEVLRAVARQICERKPTTKDAVAMIRHYRLGRQPRGAVDDLTDRLTTLIVEYIDSHAGVDAAMIREALTTTGLVIEDALE